MTGWTEKIVRARKQHRCDTCQTIIKPGSEYSRGVSFYDGTAGTWKEHFECRLVGTACHRINQLWDDGYTTDDVWEYLHDFENKWPDEAHAIVAMRMGVWKEPHRATLAEALS